MNALAEVARPKGNEIVALVEANPLMVLTDAKKFSEFYEAMKEECDAHVPDLSTERGRKAIGSLAYKVARTKTAIDDAGKKLNEEARARINAIDESRRGIRQQLDALKEEVRKPLTDWEAAEAERERLAAESLATVREMGRVQFEDTVATIKARIDELCSLAMNPEVHGDATGVAEAARIDAIAALQSAHDRLVREEAERAELEKLRAEAAERARKEQEAREAAEVALRRSEAEAAEKARIEAIAKAAEERAKAEAEAKAKAEREAADRAHAEALAAERHRAEQAERAEAERVAAAEREAAAQAAREADRAHRSKIMGAAKEAIMEAGEVDEAAAKRIVLAIAAGGVPAINIHF